MTRRLPPFSAVRAFEAAARHLSYKMAAEELCVTPSAVSHAIRALEDYLATDLFDRDGNTIRLSLTGRTYAGRLTRLLDGLDRSTREAQADREALVLRVLATPGFGARWLVPRLDRFAHADAVRLRVSDGAPSTDFATNDADVVLQWADAPAKGLIVEPLIMSGRYPVISPELKAREDVRSPKDLLRLPLFRDEVDDSWDEWFRLAGLGSPGLPANPQFPNCEYSTVAAENGQGVALAFEAVVRGTLESGRLIRLFDTVTLPWTVYALAYPEAREDEPLITAFRDWIIAESLGDGTLPRDWTQRRVAARNGWRGVQGM